VIVTSHSRLIHTEPANLDYPIAKNLFWATTRKDLTPNPKSVAEVDVSTHAESAMNNNFAVLPPNLWTLAEKLPLKRKKLLNSPALSPLKLIEQIDHETKIAVSSGLITTKWQFCEDWKNKHNGKKEFWRFEACVPIKPDTFDQFFNGCSGYRAQYYKSWLHGIDYNNAVIQKLISHFDAIIADHSGFPATWADVRQSLIGPHSKVWAGNDWALFYKEDVVLSPERWVKFWAARDDDQSGLKAPRPEEPFLDVKGSFVSSKTGGFYLPANKVDRDFKIYESGWT
jgi:hypothetical protein